MKKWIRFVALLASVTLLAGCNLIGVDSQLDAQQTVAQVGETKITKAEWQSARADMISYYQYMYSMYGMSFTTDADTLKEIGLQTLESMIQDEAIKQKAAEIGLDTFTEEELASFNEDAESTMETYRTYYASSEFAGLDAQAATVSEAIDARLSENGYTLEALVEQSKQSEVYSKVRDEFTKDVTVEEEAIIAEYDADVAAQKTTYEQTPTQYASAVNNGTQTYYTPAGYRGIKHVLIKLDSEYTTQITELNTLLSSNETAKTALETQLAELTAEPAEGEEVTDEQKAVNEETLASVNEQLAQLATSTEETNAKIATLKEEAYAAIKPEAEKVLAYAKGEAVAEPVAEVAPEAATATPDEATATPDEATATPDEATATPDEATATPDEATEAEVVSYENFDQLIEAFNEDPGMNSEPQKTTGYLVCEGLTLYETPFQQAAMALENIGDVSPLVQGNNGYHILYYAGDIEEGPVAYDEVKATIEADLLATAQDEAYNAAVQSWVDALKVKRYEKALEDVK